MTVRVRVSVPVPQVLVHVDQLPNALTYFTLSFRSSYFIRFSEATEQSTGQGCVLHAAVSDNAGHLLPTSQTVEI